MSEPNTVTVSVLEPEAGKLNEQIVDVEPDGDYLVTANAYADFLFEEGDVYVDGELHEATVRPDRRVQFRRKS